MSLDFGYWHRNGYKVHYGTSSRNYGNYQYTADVNNNTSCTISGLEEGKTYYIAVTAYNSIFESDYSKELVVPTLFSNGDELAVDFGTNGLWHYGGASWSNLTPWNPDDDLAGWHRGGWISAAMACGTTTGPPGARKPPGTVITWVMWT